MDKLGDKDFFLGIDNIFSSQDYFPAISPSDIQLIDSTMIGSHSLGQLKFSWRTDIISFRKLQIDQKRQMIVQIFHLIHFERKSWTEDNVKLLTFIIINFLSKYQQPYKYQQHRKECSFVTDEIMKLTTDNDRRVMLIGYEIFKKMIKQSHLLTGLEQILKIGLAHPLPWHKLTALKMLPHAFKQLKTQDKLFQAEGNTIFQAVKLLTEYYNNAQPLGLLLKIVQQRRHLFLGIYADITQYLGSLIYNSLFSLFKLAVTKVYIGIINKMSPLQFGETLKKSIELMKEALDPQIKQVRTQSCDPDYEQMRGKDEYSVITFGTDTICVSTGQHESKGALHFSKTAIKQCLAHQDWRMQYIGLTILSKIGFYIRNGSEIEDEVGQISSLFSNQNPILRLAACKAANRIYRKRYVQLENRVYYFMFASLRKMVQDQRVPQVQFSALLALLVGCKAIKLENQIQQLNNHVRLLLNLIANPQTLHNKLILVLEILKLTVRNAKYSYDPHILQTMNIFSSYFQYPEAKKSYLAKAKCLQILAFIFIQLNKLQTTQDNINQFIRLFIHVQASFIGQDIPISALNQLYSIFINLCKKIRIIYPHKLRAHFSTFFPIIFGIFQKDMQSQRIKTLKDYNIPQFWSFLKNILKSFISQFRPFTLFTLKFLKSILQQNSGLKIQIAACKALLQLIEATGVQQQENLAELKVIFRYVLQKVGKDPSEQESTQFIRTLETLSKIQHMLSPQDLLHFFEKWYHIFERIDQNLSTEKYQQQITKQTINARTLLMMEMVTTPLIKFIFTHQNVDPEFASFLLRNMVSKTFEKNQVNYTSLFGISACRIILQTFGSSLFEKQFESIEQLLPLFTGSKCLALKLGAWKWIEALSLIKVLNQQKILQYIRTLNNSHFEMRYLCTLQQRGNYYISAIVGKLIKRYCLSYNLSKDFREWFSKCARNPNNQFMLAMMDIVTDNPRILQETFQSDIYFNSRFYQVYQNVRRYPQYYDASVVQKINMHILALHFDASLDQGLARYRIRNW